MCVIVAVRLIQHLNFLFQTGFGWQVLNCRLRLEALPDGDLQFLLQLANAIENDWLLRIGIIRQVVVQLL